MQPTKRVLFLGLGNMGFPMATNLATSGKFHVDAFDISSVESKTPNMKIIDTLEEVSKNHYDFAITMLPSSDSFKNLYFGDLNLGNSLNKECMLIDCSTLSPLDTLDFSQKLKEELGMEFLDAPVSGGTPKAKSGTLTFMIGSETNELFEVTFLKIFKIFKKLYDNYFYFFLNFLKSIIYLKI